MSDRVVMKAFRTGATLSLTAAISYALCAAVWAIWHEQALNFLNGLFHGLDFRKILLPEREWRVGMFVYPLVVVTLAGFAFGVIFETVRDLLGKIFR